MPTHHPKLSLQPPPHETFSRQRLRRGEQISRRKIDVNGFSEGVEVIAMLRFEQ
jgi:hypothetical protein